MYRWPDGSFRSVAPPEVLLAEVRRERCFQTDAYSVGDRGLHAVTEQPKQGDEISLPRYLAQEDAAARRVAKASSFELDDAIVAYFQSRKMFGKVIHRYFGDPGLEVAAARYAGPAHQTAIARLRGRLTFIDFESALSPREQAEIKLLAADPQDFISCVARHGPKSKA